MRALFTTPARKRTTLVRKVATRKKQKTGWRPLRLDKRIVFITLAFVITGLLFTYSSSAFDSSAYFKRQLIFDFLGLVLAGFLSQTYDKLQRWKIFRPMNLMYATWVLLVIVLFMRTQANVHRWIDFGFFKLQPSEIAKVTLVIYMADYLENTAGKLAKNWKLLFKPMLVGGITLGLILAERDLGTPALMGLVFLIMLLVAGLRLRYIVGLGILISPLVIQQLFFVGYRKERILSFLNPFASEGSSGYQLVQSFLAVGSGGWFGKGLGNSELKLEYLPAAHTDFIFSVMCEELGLLLIALILAGFCWLLIRSISLARVAKTYFHSLVIFGLSITICLQAFLNMAMAIGLLPTKGIALPFFSYGGSSVIMTLVMMGIILNVAAVDHAQNNLRDDITNYKNRNK
ncbi:MAG: putative lipid II flippase FtsW [Elusimicrobiaceae bacterium]|nr:putative lipid II flippase FtsW [Elusimicrobiaceae bacterium]